MEIKNESKGLTREDVIAILGNDNILDPINGTEDSRYLRIKQQQESLACDAIG